MSVIFIVQSLRLTAAVSSHVSCLSPAGPYESCPYCLHGGTFTGVSRICPSASTLVDLAPVRPTAMTTYIHELHTVQRKALALLNSSLLVGKKHNWGT